jgi:energy-coupling factor transporter ATP-binding protein EcfA2
MARVLFLSHAGIDTEAAKALKARILAAPVTRDNGLAVWFDKDDLDAGKPWQSQIETAIERSHAFAVYVGSKGVVNWVDAEVRLALNRAITEPHYRFIPVLAGGAPGPEALPGFARQFQGVVDVESRPDQFDALLRAILDGTEAGQLQLESEPFFGLRAIDESRSHLFFGREDETEALLARVHQIPLVMVTGDSGCGKSSLVRAGLIPRFHGGALALLNGTRPEDAIWHTVATRPRNEPFRQLGEAVNEAAKGLGLPLADRGTLADWAASGELGKVRRALRCDLPAERARVLLVVDQFEELLTIAPPEVRGRFIDLLLDLADPADNRIRVVLTMRHDYVNLCSAFERLKDRLEADHRRARYLLGRVSDEGLHRIVTEPLRLAGIDAADREALAVQVLRDVGERPGDLALVQMALTETWQARHRHGGDLLRAYAEVGGVKGALAEAAERVRTQMLDGHQQTLLDSILLRLVRLGDTGGATRRVAARTEFDDARWQLVQKLASEEGKRLVLLGGSPEQPTIEIAHEALVTAWPYFQNLLQANADDKRVFDAIIPRAQAWAASKNRQAGDQEARDQKESEKRLATGADLELFADLLDRRAGWLSHEERQFVEASAAAEARKRRRDRWITRALGALAVTLFIAFGVAGWMSWRATEAEEVATAAAKTARTNESRALAALSEVASSQHRYVDAVKLAVAAWPRIGEEDRPKLRSSIKALGTASRSQRQTIPPLRRENPVRGAVFSGDERHILSWSNDSTARVSDAATGEELVTLRHEYSVHGALFSGDERRILSWSDDVWSDDGTARVWDAASGEALLTLRHEGLVRGALFSGDERRILSWSEDGTARVWDISRLPEGHVIDVACGLLPDHDTSELKDRYGIAITTPICGPDTPAPVAAELQD